MAFAGCFYIYIYMYIDKCSNSNFKRGHEFETELGRMREDGGVEWCEYSTHV